MSTAAFNEFLHGKHRLRWWELTPFIVLFALPFIAPNYLLLATQIVVYIIFALSLDLLVGYAGVITLGHAMFFGIGAYTVGIVATHAGWHEAISGLLLAAILSGLAGMLLGAIILRTARFTLLMLTLSAVFLANEVANKAGWLTGGVDGLSGFDVWPVFGIFAFDIFGFTAFIYASAALVIAWFATRWIVHSTFGQSIAAIRDNRSRAAAVGMAVHPRLIVIYGISCAMAGFAGALQTEVLQFVGLKAMSFELSADILIMLAIGGSGRIYGAFLGPAIYLTAQDYLAKDDPVLWQLWLGLIVILVATMARGGLIGLLERMTKRFKR
jgi:branched-chain amino acid transport system permease protein